MERTLAGIVVDWDAADGDTGLLLSVWDVAEDDAGWEAISCLEGSHFELFVEGFSGEDCVCMSC